MTIFNNNSRNPLKQDATEVWDRSRQRLHAGAVLLAVCAFSATAPVWAQDVAEAARQARKAKQTNGLKHVYTEEDLKRARILTREDRELLDAKKREETVPGAAPDATAIDAENLDQLPLGDVARMFRALKELKSQPGEYHLPSTDAVLASPKAEHEFATPKPRSAQPTNHGVPTAPALSNPAPASAKTNVKFVMAKPREVQPSTHATPAAPILSNGQTIAAPAFANALAAAPKSNAEFVMPKPREVQPATNVAPTAPVFSNSPAPSTIIARRGDTFWKLAQVNLGDGHRWHELAAVNPSIVDPQHILPGMVINIAGTMPLPVAPGETSEGKITVRKGDSLWRIAQIKLGFGGLWGCIAKANPRIHDANLIYTGQVLNLPSTCEDKR